MTLLYLIDGTTQPQTMEDCTMQLCEKCCYEHLRSVKYYPCITKITRCQVMNLLFNQIPKDDETYVDMEE